MDEGLKPDDLCMMRGVPCRVTDYNTTDLGKHGSEKAIVTYQKIFTGEKFQEVISSNDIIPRPVIKETSYRCSFINDRVLYLFDLEFPFDFYNNWLKLTIPDDLHLRELR